MTITPATLIRSAAVAAIAAGIIFIGIQIKHPHSDVTAVTTTEWAVRNSLKIVMAALALAGITGMYLRQVKQIGLLGLVGYLIFCAGYLTISAVAFVSAYVLPAIAETNPGYVNDVLAAATMCTTSGAGPAAMRALAGRRCGPPAISSTRSDPKKIGRRLRTTSATGTPQLAPATAPAPVPGCGWRVWGRGVSTAPAGGVIENSPRSATECRPRSAAWWSRCAW